MQFNNSYRLRQHEVNKMLAVVVIGLFIIILMILVNRHLSIIPSSVMTITMIVIISLVGIYCIRQIIKILLRSHMDFTKIEMDEPEELKKESADVDESDLLAANEVDYCVGSLVVTKERLLIMNNCYAFLIKEETEEQEESVETFQNLQPSMCNSPYEEGKYAKI